MQFRSSSDGVFLSCSEIKDFKNIRTNIIHLLLLQEQYIQNYFQRSHETKKNRTTGNKVFDLPEKILCLKYGFSEQHILKAIKDLEKKQILRCLWAEKNSLIGLKIMMVQVVSHE